MRPAIAASGATPIATPHAVDPDDAERARMGQFFIAVIDREAGSETVPTSDPDADLTILLYDAQVTRVLKGDARGAVRLWVEGASDGSRLEPGDRVLLFAGYDPAESRYPVSADLGVLRIGSDAPEAELIVRYAAMASLATPVADGE